MVMYSLTIIHDTPCIPSLTSSTLCVNVMYTTEYTVQYTILEGENFGKTVHTKNWRILLWRMPKITKPPKRIIMC